MSTTTTPNAHFSDKQLDQAQSKSFTIVDQTRLCVECLDHRAALRCLQCDDQYCDLCFAQLHRFGFRALHRFELLEGLDIHTVHLNDFALPTESNDTTIATTKTTIKATTKSTTTASNIDLSQIKSKDDLPAEVAPIMIFYPSFEHRLRFIPLRLNDYERKLLHILESTLNISEYTDKVDILQSRNREQIITSQISSAYNTISALYISGEFKKGLKLFLTEGKTGYINNKEFFQHVFEIGRRHKIRNPDKIRSGYGKLMAIVADSKSVRNSFGFDLAVKIRTVQDRCQQWGIEALLDEPLLEIATAQIDMQSNKSNNHEMMQMALEIRNSAVKTLTHKYSQIASQFLSDSTTSNGPIWLDDDITKTKKIAPEHINLLISSISDAHNYLYQCFTPLTKMSDRLNEFFSPGKQVLPIDIRNGTDGSRLSHGTDAQYQYIAQTYFLWRQVVIRMYQLWFAADHDLLCGWTSYNAQGQEMSLPVSYQLRFTEQGITRMQSCPQVGKLMSEVMQTCFRYFNNQWVGSSAVHLGDTNVPNSLAFIDKYTQLERILAPLNRTLHQVESAWNDDKHPLHDYMKEYMLTALGSKNNTNVTPLHYLIMQDYFRHAFNGSGADNYNSAGSCIDGRLTSSWEWCNIISKKAYHQAFLITGFVGWDG